MTATKSPDSITPSVDATAHDRVKCLLTIPRNERSRSARCADKWHLDEVVISIAGKRHWLWRAVDQHGVVLDILVQSRRNAKAAKRLLRKLLKKQGRRSSRDDHG